MLDFDRTISRNIFFLPTEPRPWISSLHLSISIESDWRNHRNITHRSIVRWQSRRYGIKFCEKKRKKKKQIGSYFFLFESKIACTWQLRTKNETNKHRRLMLEIISRWFHSDDDLWIEQESKQSNQALSITFHLDRSYSSIFDMFDCCRFLSKSKKRKNISQVNTMISMIMIGQQDWIWNKQNWCSNIITKNWIDAWITMNWFNDWNQNWWTFFVFFFRSYSTSRSKYPVHSLFANLFLLGT